jgi:hypothetical protein
VPATSASKTRRTAAAPVTSALPAVGAAAVQAWAELGTEAVRFVWERLHQDIQTQQALLACTSLEQIQKVQADFFRDAQQHYATEAQRMFHLMEKAFSAGQLPPSPSARRYDDVPL